MANPLGKESFIENITILFCFICVGVFVSLLYATDPTQLVIFMAGQFFTCLLMCVNYFVGTSKSSSEKQDKINGLIK